MNEAIGSVLFTRFDVVKYPIYANVYTAVGR